MARRFAQAREIGGEALQLVGAWAPSEREPRDADLKRAVLRLHRRCATMAATRYLPWLRRVYTVALTTGTATYSYDLAALTQSSDQADATIIDRWRSAWLIDNGGNRTKLDLLFEDEWDARCEQQRTGRPCAVFIERTISPTLHVDRAPTDGLAWSIEIVGQQEAIDLRGKDGMGGVDIEVPDSWFDYLAYRCAVDIGRGAVRRVPPGEMRGLEQEMARMEAELFGASAKNHLTPRISEPWSV